MAVDRVGFVGVGLMGHGMAKNIVEKGHPLTIVAHRNREPIEDLKSRGAREAADLHELAAQSDIVVICVTGSPQVEATLTGPGGLASAGRKLIVCDCSTSDPSSTVRLAASLAPLGITLVDAPLSRTPKDAEAGTLDVMAGGDDTSFERLRPVLETFAGRTLRTGPTGRPRSRPARRWWGWWRTRAASSWWRRSRWSTTSRSTRVWRWTRPRR